LIKDANKLVANKDSSDENKDCENRAVLEYLGIGDTNIFSTQELIDLCDATDSNIKS